MDDDNDTEGTEDKVAHEVVWLSRAQRHLTEIVVYIAEDNPTAAISVKGNRTRGVWSGSCRAGGA